MFGKSLVVDMVNRSAETPADRRNFLRGLGLAGAGVVGAGALGAAAAGSASAVVPDAALTDADRVGDATILNFALNLEYLEAEFYSYAAYGHGLEQLQTEGKGTMGPVTGGRRVLFKDRRVRQYAEEIANDEIAHVKFLRSALGPSAVSRPAINLRESFTTAARAAKVIGATETFDPFSSDEFFLLGAYIFEDLGVTAYKGAASALKSASVLEAAAGILAVEAYHAGIIRYELLDRGLADPANKISDARDSLDGTDDLDQGITLNGVSNLVPTDANSIVFSRTPAQVLGIAYLSGDATKPGGFYPNGVNS